MPAMPPLSRAAAGLAILAALPAASSTSTTPTPHSLLLRGADAPPGSPRGYPAALVPEPVLFPEPRSLSYGNTTLHLQPGATTCRLEGRAAASGIVSRAAARYFGQRGLAFPWGSRGAAPAPAFVISIDVASADEELQSLQCHALCSASSRNPLHSERIEGRRKSVSNRRTT